MTVPHAVVIVNFNGFTDTIECIDSVKRSKNSPKIIVVDNASTDDSVSQIKSRDSDIILIESSLNLGYAGGNNIGIKRALELNSQVIHILNNDTTVDPNSLELARRYVVETGNIVTGKILYSKGKEFHTNQRGKGNVIWYAGGHIDWSTGLAVHRGVDQPDRGQYDDIQNTSFLTGCYFAASQKAFKIIGGFDEDFFLYLEDVDFTLRSHHSGFSTIYNPNIKIYHKNAASSVSGSDFVDYYLTRNRMLLAKKYKKYRLLFALIKDTAIRSKKNSHKLKALSDFLLNKLGRRDG